MLDVRKLSKQQLQELTLRCMVEMRQRTGHDLVRLSKDMMKTKKIEGIILEVENGNTRI